MNEREQAGTDAEPAMTDFEQSQAEAFQAALQGDEGASPPGESMAGLADLAKALERIPPADGHTEAMATDLEAMAAELYPRAAMPGGSPRPGWIAPMVVAVVLASLAVVGALLLRPAPSDSPGVADAPTEATDEHRANDATEASATQSGARPAARETRRTPAATPTGTPGTATERPGRPTATTRGAAGTPTATSHSGAVGGAPGTDGQRPGAATGPGRVSGRVTSVGGSALSGAVVIAIRADGTVQSARTGDDGRYELSLQPGTYRLRAEANGHRDMWHANAVDRDGANPLEVRAGASHQNVDFALKPEPEDEAPTSEPTPEDEDPGYPPPPPPTSTKPPGYP